MEEKKQIFTILALLVVLIVVWVIVLNPPKKSTKEEKAVAEEEGLEFKVILEMADEYSKNVNDMLHLSFENIRDPFSLYGGQKEENETADRILTGLKLTGILWDNKKPLAIINSEIVREGGMMNGVKIKKIEQDHVVLVFEGEEWLLFIEGIQPKQNSSKTKMEGEEYEKGAPIGID